LPLNERGEFALAHPEIAWAQMRGMCNRMVHGYVDMGMRHLVPEYREQRPVGCQGQ
jgi:uncharacterized protein with HEPN domain